MHRGSSKGGRGGPPPPGSLPLSASPGSLSVVLEVTRGGSVERHRLRVVPGTMVRAALLRVGQAPEGCAVLIDDVPVPLDTVLDRPIRLTVVPTFSGG